MARKPKTQPSITTVAALPAEKVAAMIETLAPAHRGRKALVDITKPSVSAAVAAALQANAGGDREPKPRKAKAQATPDAVNEGALGSAARPHAQDNASGGLASVKPAVHWDRATGAIQFDWPAIEQMASHAGANQGMAKLLIAARAEGANSRWPL